MEREIDAKTWYRQRNIWFAVLHKPHLTIVIPLLILIIIGLLQLVQHRLQHLTLTARAVDLVINIADAAEGGDLRAVKMNGARCA